MHFLRRSFVGLFLLTATLALFGTAGTMVYDAVQAKMSEQPRERVQRERVLSVNTLTLTPQTIAPKLVVFGEVLARRALDLRTSTDGAVISVSPDFEDGGTVSKGDVLLRIDPTQAQAQLSRAQANVQDAAAELRAAQRALVLAQDELQGTQEQAQLRKTALQRQLDLRNRGVGTAAAVESAELAVSSANQSILANRKAIDSVQSRIDQATTNLMRITIDQEAAQRAVQDTTVTAAFSGTLAEVTVVEGGRVTNNQLVARLIDPTQLEVAFRISTAQYARLLDSNGALIGAEALVELDVQGVNLRANATITRESATAADGQTGRLVFASLSGARGLRPGDFVTVTITEPDLDRVALVPATAVAADNTVLVIGDDDRLTLAPVELLRRQGDDVIIRVRDLRAARIVAERSPTLGAGIKVRPIQTDGTTIAQAPDMITLTPERRAKIVAFIEANNRMPAQAKARIMAQLEGEQISAQTVERLESRMRN